MVTLAWWDVLIGQLLQAVVQGEAYSFQQEKQCALTPIAFVLPGHKSEEIITEWAWHSEAEFMQRPEVPALMRSATVVIWSATPPIASWCMAFVRPMTP